MAGAMAAAFAGVAAASPGPIAADAVYAFEGLHAPAHPDWSRSEPVALRLSAPGSAPETLATAATAVEAALRSWGAASVVQITDATSPDPWAPARAAGCELGVDITLLDGAVEAQLVELGGGLWDEGVRGVARRRVAAGESAGRASLPTARTMQVEPLATFDAPIRAIEACGPWVVALGDRDVHRIDPDGVLPSATVALDPLEPGVAARDPATLLACSSPRLRVAHGAWRRSGTLELPSAEAPDESARALRPAARLALGRGLPSLEVEPGTNRWRGRGLDHAIVDAAWIEGAWWLVRADGQLSRRGPDGAEVELAARAGRGLAAMPGAPPGFAVTSDPDGPPEALVVMDAEGRLDRRLPLPEPVLDLATSTVGGRPVVFILHGAPHAPRLSRVTW